MEDEIQKAARQAISKGHKIPVKVPSLLAELDAIVLDYACEPNLRLFENSLFLISYRNYQEAIYDGVKRMQFLGELLHLVSNSHIGSLWLETVSCHEPGLLMLGTICNRPQCYANLSCGCDEPLTMTTLQAMNKTSL